LVKTFFLRFLAAGLVAWVAPSARAQATSRAGAKDDFILAGTVLRADSAVVIGADVQLLELGAATRTFTTDSLGHFLITHLTSRAVTLRVRALGYAPKQVEIRIQAEDGRAGVIISLEPSVTKLAGMSVNDTTDDPDRKLADFRARKGTNHFAHFVDEEEIDLRKPAFISEMLRPVPGVTVTPNGRFGNIVRLRGCSPLVWVDGVRMPGAQLDDLVSASDVAAIEVYNSFAGIPARYFDRTATCGTILVWIKS
jgi:hypothetical protein